MRTVKLRWKTEALDGLPRLSKKKHAYKVWSVRVIVSWRWFDEVNNKEDRELKFAKYNHKEKYWCIEGISGKTEVLEWARIRIK